MADADIAITAGAGTKVDTRTVGAGTDEHRQVMCIGDPVTAAQVAVVDANNSLSVNIREDKVWYGATAVPGVAAAAYLAGDQFGTLITLTNAARFSGGGGTIRSVTFVDGDDLITSMDIKFYNASVTPAADNAAFSVSDADNDKLLWTCRLTFFDDQALNRANTQNVGTGVPYVCSGGTSLYALVIVQTSYTLVATASPKYQICLARD
jgi:hypothetical protein